jgi:hypothetical protein
MECSSAVVLWREISHDGRCKRQASQSLPHHRNHIASLANDFEAEISNIICRIDI